MYLYLLTKVHNLDYDKYESMVVAAKSREDAKTILPDEKESFFNLESYYKKWVSVEDRDKLVITYLGKAAPGIKRGEICASYRAG